MGTSPGAQTVGLFCDTIGQAFDGNPGGNPCFKRRCFFYSQQSQSHKARLPSAHKAALWSAGAREEIGSDAMPRHSATGLVYQHFPQLLRTDFYLVRLVLLATQLARIKQDRYWIVSAAFG
jgi:hypothetical protein